MTIIWVRPLSFLGVLESDSVFFLFFITFFYEIPLSKQSSPRCDAAFCAVSSGAMHFCLCPTKWQSGLYEVKYQQFPIMLVHTLIPVWSSCYVIITIKSV